MCDRVKNVVLAIILLLVCMSCSTTKSVPDGDRLFVGLKKIAYVNDSSDAHYDAAKEEVEAALATQPNGALFGSSYYRSPFPMRLWVWNFFSGSRQPIDKWIAKHFGKPPVLMSWVNPELRATVAKSVLRNKGFFHSDVSYTTIPLRNPKKAKIGYTVSMGDYMRFDSIEYVGFTPEMDSIIGSARSEACIRRGQPFAVDALDAERQRISTLMRNNGYYFYQPAYTSYLADTVQVKGKAQMRFVLAKNTPALAMKRWYVGKLNIALRKRFNEQLNDSLVRRTLNIRFNGKKPPITPRALLADMKIRPRQEFNYDNYMETVQNINAMGLFSQTDFVFTPRDTTAACDTLDLTMNCVFDKPWDFYVETNFKNRTIGRLGPELKVGVTRRNAFRGGEKLDINLHGSYEWETSGSGSGNSYSVGADASVEFPRLITPFNIRGYKVRAVGGKRVYSRRFFTTPSTVATISADIVNRPSYFRMYIASAEWTYRWQTSERSRHELSPLTLKYQFKSSHTAAYDSLMQQNPYLKASMDDYLIPKMRYTYTYSSPKSFLNPIRWETTVSEAGNFTSLGFLIGGRRWNEKGKKIFNNPYSQFVKVETDFTKTWRLSASSHLVGHVNAGVMFNYGNSDDIPYSEMFYVGGANSVRAYTVRGIGPGSFPGTGSRKNDYLMRNGTLKLVMNLEWRQRLFGSLYGAIFLDAGNVWSLEHLKSADNASDEELAALATADSQMHFDFKDLFSELAVATGVGIRYDLDFLIIRLDWGVGLHVPYETSRSGFFNVDKFKDHQTWHFSIGYPF